ncbi:MAG: tRNA (adenosine(37)-N6)-threonylcarbamoyltransferase complex ATPase subunit type 1 TsaE [Pseudomonadota bacterium]
MVSEPIIPYFQIEITTRSPGETRRFGRRVGRQVDAGTVVALYGGLGSGKTVFVQGLARGLDVPSGYYVTSPSYTLINEYPGRHPLFHVDLYRLGNIFDFEDIGLYEILGGDGVVAIEWADRIREDFSAEYIAVHFEVPNGEIRKIRLTAYGHRGVNLLKGFEKNETD